jgi:hypothetical protein
MPNVGGRGKGVKKRRKVDVTRLSPAQTLNDSCLEADNALSKKDTRMRIRICLKESLESEYWLRRLGLKSKPDLVRCQDNLPGESTELAKIFATIARKLKENGPSILAGEDSTIPLQSISRHRTGPEMGRSLLFQIHNSYGWHWAYRSNGEWAGLDYELGVQPHNWKYWKAGEEGQDPEKLKNRHDNPLWKVIKRKSR